MTIDEIIDRNMPFTSDERSCAIKRATKQRQRDAMKYDVLNYIASQVKALQRAETPKKEYGQL